MDFKQLAKERFSVRSFRQEHLPNDVINQLLEIAHLAPTGCNFQPQRILVLNTDQSLTKLKSCTKCHFDAPTAMLICYNKNECWTRKYDQKTSGVSDACIVATHIMLAATEKGIGTTWVMHFDPAAMRETFAIPSEIEPVALIVMGYPSEDAVANKLHTEFRPIEQTVVYESF